MYSCWRFKAIDPVAETIGRSRYRIGSIFAFVDIDAVEELVAHDRSVTEIAEIIGADWLIYQDLDDLIDAVQKGNRSITEFDCSCFDGKYVTQTIDNDYLDKISDIRRDSAKDNNGDQKLNLANMDLHNNL